MTTVLTKSFPQEKPPVTKAVPGKKRVLIVGGGFAGIATARALKRANVEITLVDRRNHHIFQPLLYQVATAVLSPSEIAAPIRQLEAKQKNLSVLLAEVKGINLGARTVEAICPGVGSRKLEYDFLVIAAGMRPSYFGHDEFARFAPGLKSLNDAETIRTKILGAFELAESTDDEKERARQMTFVLVGAGPTGVELDFRKIDPAKSRIVLLDGGARVLPTFAESLSRKAAKRLTKLGVEVSTGVKVERVDDQGVIAAGVRIPSATVLWTAGVSASPVVKMLGTQTDRAGRAFIGAFMDIPEAPNVFVRPRSGAGSHSTGPICRTCHRQPCQGTQGWPTVSIPQQRQYGGGGQELRHPRVPLFAQQRLCDLAGVGRATRARAATASEPVPRPNPMVLVLSVGATELTADFRRAAVDRVVVIVRPVVITSGSWWVLHLWTPRSSRRSPPSPGQLLAA